MRAELLLVGRAELDEDRIGLDQSCEDEVIGAELDDELVELLQHVPKPAWQPSPQYSGPSPL